MMAEPLLRIQEISKTYPGVQALRAVTFDIQPGQVHALVGENGAGKSTLIKILSGSETPDPGGEVLLRGAPFRPRDPTDAFRASISTIHQALNLLPDRSVMHNVLVGREPTRHGRLDKRSMLETTHAILRTLDAEHISPKALARDLKVGEKQIVEIAKALVNQSVFLIMDEPTSALNQAEADALFANIRRLRAAGVTILYVTHRLDEVFALSDTVTVLRDGQHISTDPTGAVTRDSLIFHMIGRELSDVFPARRSRPGKEVLRVEGLACAHALHDVTFSLHEGEVLAVTGLSGSGKTELGRALQGDLPIDAGSVLLAGRALKPSPLGGVLNHISYLPEDRKVDGVLGQLTVRRNLSISVLATRVANRLGVLSRRRERALAQQQIDSLNIKTPSMEQHVLNLSGGNQQKVILGRCMAADPNVFILMEPTQGIDVGAKFELYQFIVDQAAEGRAILMISSELAEILGISHRVIVLRGGSIVADLESQATSQEEVLRLALGE